MPVAEAAFPRLYAQGRMRQQRALRRVNIQEKTKHGEYLVADDIAAVVALVQMGMLEIDTWNSTVDDIEQTNRIVWDLDPGATC